MSTTRAEQYRERARECATLANAVPSKDRQTLLEMAREWERLADQQQWGSDLGPKE
jgi:hypothetical protein